MAERPHTLTHSGGPSEVTVHTISDGRTTVTEILHLTRDGWKSLGVGVAKRRKNEANYPQYGAVLSAKRAFEDASKRLGEAIEEFENTSHEDRRRLWR